MAEVQKYEGTVRKQMQEGLTDTEEMRAIKEIRQKYKAYYTEQMEKLHQKQAEDVMQGGQCRMMSRFIIYCGIHFCTCIRTIQLCCSTKDI